MAYNDSQFTTPIQETVIGGGPALGVLLGSVTASATQTYTGTAGTQVNGTYRFPVFKTPTKLTGIRVYTVVAAGAGVTGVSLGFFNGTTVIANVTPGAAGTFVDVTMPAVTVASNGGTTAPHWFTSTNNEVLMVNTATGTASGSTLGSYSVDFIWQGLFTT